MFHHVTTGSHNRHPVRRTAAFALMMLMTIGAASSIVNAKAIYIVDDGETRTTVETNSYVPSAVIEKAGIQVSDTDQITTDYTTGGPIEIKITRSQEVAINYMGSTLHVQAYEENVSALLERLNIELGEEDEVSVDLSNYTENGMVIDVDKYTHETVTAQESITYTTERVANASMASGKESVKQDGKNGVAKVTYDVTYKNGAECSREPISSEVVTAPMPEIVEYGTKSGSVTSSDRIQSDKRNSNGSGVLTFKSGSTLSYSRALNVSATAYTAKAGARTASGKAVYVGGIAVDPKVIPLGSKLYITTANGKMVYGMATAIDTGGAIKGNKIDLFYNTYNECVQFGRRNCTVYVLN